MTGPQLLRVACVCAALALSAPPAVADLSRPWMDAAAPVPQRVEALLSQMTIDEKIHMTFATHTSARTAERFQNTSVGAVKFMSAFSCRDNITSCVSQRNDLMRFLINGSRLGIPPSVINEGLHQGSEGGTVFPMPINQAMTWNVSLISAIGRAIALEASAIGVDTIFKPVVNMMADPRFGRLEEGYGENPTITAHLGFASMMALQGNITGVNDYYPPGTVAALGKHFAAYGAAVGGLNGGPAEVSNLTLQEEYLRPWRAMASRLRGCMPSHQTVLHQPAHGNPWLIKTWFRGHNGFGGVALSDCNDIPALMSFGFASNHSHAAGIALEAGVDWDLQCSSDPDSWGYSYIQQALDEGLTTEETLDNTVRRVLTQKFAAHLFDEPYTSLDNIPSKINTPQHQQLAKEAADQSIVLLQNTKGALPMDLTGVKVGLFGPVATGGTGSTALEGGYTIGGTDAVTIDAALNASGISYEFLKGCDGSGPPGTGCDLDGAVALAKTVGVSILVLGDQRGQCGEWQDRDSLDLAGGQLELLEAVAGVAPVTIVVLAHGRPQTFGVGNVVLAKVDALLAAWRPGQFGGPAILDLISGKVNPSGKLAQSWPRTVGHVGGPFTPWLQRIRGKWVSNNKNCDATLQRCADPYVSDGFKTTPLFPFGFGMSYTTFEYSKIAVSKPSLDLLRTDVTLPVADQSSIVLSVQVTLQNTGKVAGREAVQLYVRDPTGQSVAGYWRRLLGFGAAVLAPAQTAVVTIDVMWSDLALFGADMVPQLRPGVYQLFAGGSSELTPLATNITI